MTRNDLKKFKFEVYPPKGIKTEWIIRFPDVNNIGGGGDTFEEALEDAYENLDAEISYLEDTNQDIPNPEENDYSGKVLVRLGKNLHKTASKVSAQEGISLNQFLCNATSYYIASIISTSAAAEFACSRLEEKVNKRADKMCDKYVDACNSLMQGKRKNNYKESLLPRFNWSFVYSGGGKQ